MRAGAIIPMGPVKQYTDEPVDAPLSITVYPGADGAFTLYEDDGKTFAHKSGDFMRLAMTWNEASRRFAVALAPGSRMRPPISAPLDVRLSGSTAPRRLIFTGKPIEDHAVIVDAAERPPDPACPNCNATLTYVDTEISSGRVSIRRRRRCRRCRSTTTTAVVQHLLEVWNEAAARSRFGRS